MYQQNVLKLDIAGIPEGWITSRDAAELIAKDLMAWSLGDVVETFHGGIGRSGSRTIIEVPSIVAVNGVSNIYLPDIPIGVTREKIFQRDRNCCAYCAVVLHPKILQAEHIIPYARGGPWSWTNLVASCNHCNQIKKKCQTPDEAGMPLLYLPYVPSRWENLIMEGRHIKTDQMEFLMASVPKHSRLRPV